MPTWLDRLNGKKESEDPKEKEQADLELKNITDSVNKIKDIESKVAKIDEISEVAKGMKSFLTEQEDIKRQNKAKQLADKAKESNKQVDDELEEMFVTDPKRAAEIVAQRQTQPITMALINTQSQMLRKQIFDDNPQEFEYYTNENSDFKKNVDSLIDGLPLENKTNPEAIKNCYAVAAFKQQQAIKEGKLKSRFASVSTSSAGNNNTGDKNKIVLTELQKKAAAAFGLSEDDYGKQAREMNYV